MWPCRLCHVTAHDGHPRNELADSLAKAAGKRKYYSSPDKDLSKIYGYINDDGRFIHLDTFHWMPIHTMLPEDRAAYPDMRNDGY